MRPWDRIKPEERLGPRLEPLHKSQVSQTDRGVMPASNMPTQRHGHDRCYQRRLPANLTVFKLGLVEEGRTTTNLEVPVVYMTVFTSPFVLSTSVSK